MRLYSAAVVAFSVAFLLIGAALLVRTAAAGGGAVGFLAGALFLALGAARLALERRRRGP
ncbi:MAG TPA: hypothetical protein VNJ46_02410 [Gaiellaceae bacterium]|nr:hypothetical protein [Gaiellaceae bacterium]